MDLISNMLTTLRLDASVFLHSTFCQEWVVDVGDFDVATFHLVSHGNCWLHLPNHKPIPLQERDLIVLPHNATHFIANSPEQPSPDTPRNTPADAVCGPSVTLICGTVTFSQNYWNPLVEALPEYVILSTLDSRHTTLGKVIDALINECEESEAGSEVIIDRLADILFIEVLRNYVKKECNSTFFFAITDPKISAALKAFHSNPGESWSVQMLADTACMSRSAFAERFQKFTGVPPMHYVTRWRMHFAHCKLTETADAIGDIAESCGYSGEDSFFKAFRKEFGISPSAVRRRESVNEIVNMVTVNSNVAVAAKILYTPKEANRLRLDNEVIFIDVRDRADYMQAHLPGAVNVPELFYSLSMTTPEGLCEMQEKFQYLLQNAGVDRDKTVIVYEDNLGTRFGGSCRGYFQLMFFGHPSVGVLDGGLEQWKAEGFALDEGPVYPAPSEFDALIQRDYLATVDDVIMSLEHPEIKLLDNRDKDEWLGITSSPADFYEEDFLPRKGRIPGARWLEWHQFMENTDGVNHFKPPEQITAICAQAGLYPDDDIIIYCFKGSRSSNTFIALKLAGFKHVRNYYGSWNEWSRVASLPVFAAKLVG
ncbi:MAG: cupin domain-containing protein [Pseudomonadales bacterium]